MHFRILKMIAACGFQTALDSTKLVFSPRSSRFPSWFNGPTSKGMGWKEREGKDKKGRERQGKRKGMKGKEKGRKGKEAPPSIFAYASAGKL